MKSGEQTIAAGAALMIALKLLERMLGVISTIVLARLLVPEDFGLVAMAMAIFALLELAGQFGFDHAIIRQSNPPRSHLDTAWTLTVCHGLLSAAILVSTAELAANFFEETRLENVIYFLALTATIQSFENIGIILFRKEMQFKRDFIFFASKKLIAFFFTLILALTFKSYWALIGGTLASRLAGVCLSYFFHPYRPRLSFTATKELLGFSGWVLITGLLGYLSNRGPDFFLGRYTGASSVGLFRVASELATLPTTELMYPIARAAYPGYAQVAADPHALKTTYLAVQGSIVMLTLPAGVGLVMVADPFVKALLGFQWLEAVPLIQILGLYGALRIFQTTNHAIFNVLGKPYWNTTLLALELLASLPLFGWLLHNDYGLQIAALSYFSGSVIAIPIAVALVTRFLGLTLSERFRITWRPLASTFFMAASLHFLFNNSPPSLTTWHALRELLLMITTGATIYAVSIYILWTASGRPDGTENEALKRIRKFLKNQNLTIH